jgi:Tfp pilus assembly protein PilO
MNLDSLRHLPKNKLQKVVLVGVVMLCAVMIVTQVYVVANLSALGDAKKRIAKCKDQIQQAENAARQAVQDEAYRQQVKSFVETQQTTMITGDPFAWVVREISLLAEKHPVHVAGLRPGGMIESADKSKSQTYTSRIEFTGTYDQIGAFVCDLENKFPTSAVRMLSISGSPEDKGQHQAAVDLALRIQPEQLSKKVEEKKTS